MMIRSSCAMAVMRVITCTA
uniref:Uncharacterized protein n=1 Tax=Arundo donax TaxID=35708 RepID=A0A0A9HG35_ARUDO